MKAMLIRDGKEIWLGDTMIAAARDCEKVDDMIRRANQPDITSAVGLFTMLRLIQEQCESRARALAAAGDGNDDDAEDWADLAGRIDDVTEGLEHMQY